MVSMELDPEGTPVVPFQDTGIVRGSLEDAPQSQGQNEGAHIAGRGAVAGARDGEDEWRLGVVAGDGEGGGQRTVGGGRELDGDVGLSAGGNDQGVGGRRGDGEVGAAVGLADGVMVSGAVPTLNSCRGMVAVVVQTTTGKPTDLMGLVPRRGRRAVLTPVPLAGMRRVGVASLLVISMRTKASSGLVGAKVT